MSDSDDFGPSAFSRLERKLDKLTDAVSKLILLEERQITQASRLTAVEIKQSATEKKVDQWINRGVGMWALCAVIFTLAVAAFNIIKSL